MTSNQGGVVRQAGEGPSVSYLGTTATFKVLSGESGGLLSAVEFTTPTGPAPGPPAHTHPHAETFVVLDGRMMFLLGDQRVVVEPGGIVFAPGNAVHTFANLDPAPARFLTLFSPGGFEAYFEEVAALVQSFGSGPPDMSQIASLAAKYEQTVVEPPLTL